MEEKSPAEIAFDEISERLAEPEEKGPKYLSVAPPTNHAMRRFAKLNKKRAERTFDRWWLRMLRLGINPEDVIAERRRKLMERVKDAARPVGQDEPAGAAGGDSAEADSAA